MITLVRRGHRGLGYYVGANRPYLESVELPAHFPPGASSGGAKSLEGMCPRPTSFLRFIANPQPAVDENDSHLDAWNLFFMDGGSSPRYSTNHHLGSNSSLSLTPCLFSMQINHLGFQPSEHGAPGASTYSPLPADICRWFIAVLAVTLRCAPQVNPAFMRKNSDEFE